MNDFSGEKLIRKPLNYLGISSFLYYKDSEKMWFGNEIK